MHGDVCRGPGVGPRLVSAMKAAPASWPLNNLNIMLQSRNVCQNSSVKMPESLVNSFSTEYQPMFMFVINQSAVAELMLGSYQSVNQESCSSIL